MPIKPTYKRWRFHNLMCYYTFFLNYLIDFFLFLKSIGHSHITLISINVRSHFSFFP
jgi:hypothetical protein